MDTMFKMRSYLTAVLGVVTSSILSPIYAQTSPPTYTISAVTPPPNNSNVSYPVLQINNAGQILWDYNGLYRLDAGVWNQIGDNTTTGLSMNNSGDIVGKTWITISGNSRQHAFLYSGSVLHDIGTMSNGYHSYATAVNDSDEVIGWSEINGEASSSSFYWKNGTFIPTNPLPYPYNNSLELTAINNAGQAVGISNSADGYHSHLFLLSAAMVKSP